MNEENKVENEETKTEQPKVEESKVEETKEAPKTPKVADIFKELGVEESKDRKELGQKIVDKFKELGIEKNCKGRVIIVENVTRQVGAMIKDINDARKGWWATYKVEECREKDKESLKFKAGGKQIFAKVVHHPGTRPQPFIRNTIRNKMGQIVQEEILKSF